MLTNAKKVIQKAFTEGWAVPHININNLEWTKAVLQTAEEQRSPIIVGVSEGAVKYMCGFHTVKSMVSAMVSDLKISVPVILHLDHGSYEGALSALKSGFTSVMFDGSHLPFEENIAKTKEIVALAAEHKASVEVEVGTLAGEEDGVTGGGEKADPEEVRKISALGVDFIAAGINNIHGLYPANWSGLDFAVLSKLKLAAAKGLVLHGGTGIPTDQIKKAISMGVAKINVNTELQLAFAEATRKFVRSGESEKDKNYDPRKFLKPGFEAMKLTVKEKMSIFGSVNKA